MTLAVLFLAGCAADCNQPLRDAFNFYIVNGSGDDIFELDPSLNKDSVYVSVVKNSVEQTPTRATYTREGVGVDTFNTFYNPNIPDLNINSDTQIVYLYTPRGRKDALLLITQNELDKKCGSVLRIRELKKGLTPVAKDEGYFRIVF